MKYLFLCSMLIAWANALFAGKTTDAAIYASAAMIMATIIICTVRPPRDAEIAALTIERDLWHQSEEIASRQHDKRAEEVRQLQSIARKAADFYDAYRNHEDDIQAAHDALGAAISAYADRAKP